MLLIGGGEAEDDDDVDLTTLAEEDDEEEEEEEEDEEEPSPVEVLFEVQGGADTDTFVNAGTINMINGPTGDTLIIIGDYESQDGNLAIDTALGSDDSDRLVVDGPVDGTTTVYVNNTAAGPNQSTQRVVVAEALQGGLTEDSFQLGLNAITGEREMLDGAFAYRLGINDTEAFLFGDLLDQVPGYVTAPSVAQQHILSEFGTLYQRMGELRRFSSADKPLPLRPSMWVRGSFSQADVDAERGWDFDSDNQNV
jgi:outer membrane autotransporter protein